MIYVCLEGLNKSSVILLLLIAQAFSVLNKRLYGEAYFEICWI